MALVTYKCSWANEWIAYDNNYEDEYTPHGRGATEQEAIVDFIDVLSDYFNNMEMLADYYSSAAQH